MVDEDPIPKQTLIKFLNELNISGASRIIKINAVVDISVPGRRKFCNSEIECQLHDKFVILKLLNKNLYPAFPIKFDSRDDIFSQPSHYSLSIDGYSCAGKHRVNIFPLLSLPEEQIFLWQYE